MGNTEVANHKSEAEAVIKLVLMIYPWSRPACYYAYDVAVKRIVSWCQLFCDNHLALARLNGSSQLPTPLRQKPPPAWRGFINTQPVRLISHAPGWA
jgi:hypothetical protein